MSSMTNSHNVDHTPIDDLSDSDLQNITVSDDGGNWLEIHPPDPEGDSDDLPVDPIDNNFGRYPGPTISIDELRDKLTDSWEIVYHGVTDPQPNPEGF